MGKQLLSPEQSKATNPGCMWGMFQILDYHQWHVKKVFPHKKRRHSRYKRKTNLHIQGEEDQQYGVAEAEPLLVKQHSKNNATGRSSPKNQKKEPQSDKRINEQNSEGSSEYALHLEKYGNTTEEATISRKRMETIKLNRDTSNKFKKRVDVLELVSEEKDLLLKFLRDLDVSGKTTRKALRKKARLTKSGSFPLTAPSQKRNFSSSTFKHKQYEIWTFPKGEKMSLAGTQAPKNSALRDIPYEKPMSSVSDLGTDSAMQQKRSVSSRSSEGLTHHKGWNQLVIHQFKVIKQKIKHALVEFKISGHQTSVEEITDNDQEISQGLDDDGSVIDEYSKNEISNDTKASDHDFNKHEARLMRRTSSLNESLDRYTQLFEKSFRKDAKWQCSKSKSLRLTNEDKIQKSGPAPIFSRSNMSMPSLEALGFILHEALFDSNYTGNDTVDTDDHVHRKPVSLPSKIDKSLDPVREEEIVETVEGNGRDVNPSEEIDGFTCDQREDMHEPEEGDESFPQEKDEISIITPLETICEDNTTSHAKGGELETDLPSKSSDNHFLLFKPDEENNSNFQYVKGVLEYSGLLGNDQIQMPYTVDQPLKHSLFKELDASLRREIESTGKEITKPCDYLLLFNLVNEVLLEIFERSPSYFPRPFFFNHRLNPMPKGDYLLNEVWTSVSSYLSLRPELDQTLDDVVVRDLAKRSGWMNLQQEEEFVALELEDMIMDDLLDELIYSSDLLGIC